MEAQSEERHDSWRGDGGEAWAGAAGSGGVRPEASSVELTRDEGARQPSTSEETSRPGLGTQMHVVFAFM